jgi:hypothetical protein
MWRGEVGVSRFGVEAESAVKSVGSVGGEDIVAHWEVVEGLLGYDACSIEGDNDIGGAGGDGIAASESTGNSEEDIKTQTNHFDKLEGEELS